MRLLPGCREERVERGRCLGLGHRRRVDDTGDINAPTVAPFSGHALCNRLTDELAAVTAEEQHGPLDGVEHRPWCLDAVRASHAGPHCRVHLPDVRAVLALTDMPAGVLGKRFVRERT